MRDAELIALRNALRRCAPDSLERLYLMGYGNTPWSYAADPPFSSVDWNLEKVADEVCALLAEIRGKNITSPTARMIKPSIIDRS